MPLRHYSILLSEEEEDYSLSFMLNLKTSELEKA